MACEATGPFVWSEFPGFFRREACLNAGMDEYPTKPIKRSDLEKLLTRLFSE